MDFPVRHVKLFISSSTLDISDEFSLAHFSIKIKKSLSKIEESRKQRSRKISCLAKSNVIALVKFFSEIAVVIWPFNSSN